jgi:hypothetical protein
MAHRTATAMLIAGLQLLLVPATAVAQAGDWSTPRTPWGHPDLQGIWNIANTGTPMERPTEFGTREFLTEEEIAARVEALVEQRASLRATRDFAGADAVRDQLTAMGIELTDSPSGTTWRVVG